MFCSRSCVIGRGIAVFSNSSAIALASKIPTQIGSTRSLPMSFSTMIGIFVTGSIISPRICISTSSEVCVTEWVEVVAISVQNHKLRNPRHRHKRRTLHRIRYRLANQAVRQRLRNPYRHVTPHRRMCLRDLRSSKVHRLILRTPAHHLPASGVVTLHHALLHLAQMSSVVFALNLPLPVHQDPQPLRLHC